MSAVAAESPMPERRQRMDAGVDAAFRWTVLGAALVVLLALIGAAVGTVVGLFMGIVGVLFMPLVGAAVGEYMARRDHEGAMKVGVATWVGLMIGMIAKVVIAFIMLGIFIAALLF